jgi:imidazolonepropionase-like amidohydrolase
MMREEHFKVFRKAWQAGVKIGCGSDILSIPELLPMGENANELIIQAQLGRSSMDVLVSATKINSEVLGMEKELGTLEAGKLADIILVNGDPLADITVLRDRSNILSIYKGGERVPRLDPSVKLARWPERNE